MLNSLAKSDSIAVASLIATLIGIIVAIWLAFRSSRHDHADYLDTDPEERARRITELRGGSFGKLYPALLERGLTLLDRRFGDAFSAKALNVCTLLALGYAYVFFHLAYVIGAPGGLGEGKAWLPADIDTATRLLVAAINVLTPPLAFLLAWWLGRFPVLWERCLKLGLRRRHRIRAYQFEIGYRISLTLVVGTLALLAGSSSDLAAGMLIFFGLVGLAVASALVGRIIAKRVPVAWFEAPLAACFGAIALAVVGAVAVAEDGAVAGALVGALTAALVGAGAVVVFVVVVGAIAIAVGIAVAVAVAGAVTGAIAGAVAIALAGAVAVAGAVGASAALLGRRQTGWRGLYAGPLGVVVGLAFIAAFFDGSGQFDEVFVVAWIALFLALPVANGVWDFGSWWISRSLGLHLLTKLGGKSGAGGQGWTIFWHIALDVALAIVFLLSLAWFLGFAFEVYHNVGHWWQGGNMGPLPFLANDITIAAADPFGKGLWLTAMLLSTLIPTLLHGTLAIVGALTLFAPITAVRKDLAEDLEALDYLDEAKRKLVLQRTGRHLANGRPGLWCFASLLLLILLALLSTGIAMIHTGGFADYVKEAALHGVGISDWLFGKTLP